jgi:hypothetical protein
MMLIACVGCVPLGTHAFWEGRQLRAWLCHTPYTRFEISYFCIRFSLSSSVGSTIRVPATGKLMVGAWKP